MSQTLSNDRMDAEGPQIISVTTILSLLSTVAILGTAYTASLSLLSKQASAQTRFLFVWHAFDALIHFILEGSYLYNCFFSSATLVSLAGTSRETVSAYLPPNVFFLNDPTRLYGAEYGTTPFSALWMEYAKADKRWGGSDLTVISLELLTVFIAGPMALWICYCLKRESKDSWYWMTILATGELYGGWMTFAPEWLSGNPNLDGSNFMYLWIYLIFFNAGLWVVIPFYILFSAHKQLSDSTATVAKSSSAKRKKTS